MPDGGFSLRTELVINVSKLYAEECVKASLEKASEKTDFLMIDIDEINVDDYEEIKKSITNPENIVLL